MKTTNLFLSILNKMERIQFHVTILKLLIFYKFVVKCVFASQIVEPNALYMPWDND